MKHLHLNVRCEGHAEILAAVKQLGVDMAHTMEEVNAKIAEVAGAVNALEAKVTEALKNAGIPADVQAQIDAAFDAASAVVADATDGVDEAAAPVVVNPV